MSIALAATHHDPDGRLIDQMARMLPALRSIFSGIAVHATDSTDARAFELLTSAGAYVRQAPPTGHLLIGRARRGAVEFSLQLSSPWIMFCDLDRALHWAEYYPDELSRTAQAITAHDFTVLGRTPRAFLSHPRTQYETETIINNVFARVSGAAWDVTAAARGLSRRAAQTIVSGCAEDSVGTDTAWPLFVQHAGSMTVGYIEAEGLEFETPDRYGQEIEALGGLDSWLEHVDSNVREWALRLDIARAEVAAMQPYKRIPGEKT
jgi:hypothetical protein